MKLHVMEHVIRVSEETLTQGFVINCRKPSYWLFKVVVFQQNAVLQRMKNKPLCKNCNLAMTCWFQTQRRLHVTKIRKPEKTGMWNSHQQLLQHTCIQRFATRGLDFNSVVLYNLFPRAYMLKIDYLFFVYSKRTRYFFQQPLTWGLAITIV